MDTWETVEKGHGRIEKETSYLSSGLSGLENATDWAGLSGFGMVRSHVIMGEVEFSEIRYAITSLKDVEQFGNAWRKYWGIENGLHDCWMCHLTKTIPASEQTMLQKIWQLFGISCFRP